MKITKELSSDTSQNVAGKLAGFEELAEDIVEIYDSGNTVAHNGEDYDATEETALAYLSQHFSNPEQTLSDLNDAEKDTEEIYNSLTNDLKVELDLPELDRRDALKYGGLLAAAANPLTYGADSLYNDHLLESAGQDNFEAPSSALYSAAVAEGPVDGDPIEVYILNFTQGDEYDADEVLGNLTSAAEELKDLEIEPHFIQPDPSLEGYLQLNNLTREDIGEDGVERANDRISKMNNAIQNNGLLGDEVKPGNRVEVIGAENPSSVQRNMDWYSSMFIPQKQLSPLPELKIIGADFNQGEFGGVAYHDEDGYNNMSLMNDSAIDNEDEFSGILIHELGHLLGLPHTQYPDMDSGQVFPDVMSYSDGDINIPYKVSQVISGERAFGRASRDNWEQVKNYVEENRSVRVDN